MKFPDRESLEGLLERLSSTSRQRGMRIVNAQSGGIGVKRSVSDPAIRVPSESGPNYYMVRFSIGARSAKASASCTCVAYELNGECKHVAAAILFLLSQDTISSGSKVVDEKKPRNIKAKGSSLRGRPLKRVNTKEWTQTIPAFTALDELLGNGYAFGRIISNAAIAYYNSPSEHTFYSPTWRNVYGTSVGYTYPDQFTFKCSCLNVKPCTHIKDLLGVIRGHYGRGVFAIFYPAEIKDRLLREVGQDPRAPEVKDFLFTIHSNGTPRLIPPSWLIAEESAVDAFSSRIAPAVVAEKGNRNRLMSYQPVAPLILVNNSGVAAYAGFQWALVKPDARSKSKDAYTVIDLNATATRNIFPILDAPLQKEIMGATHEALVKWLGNNGTHPWTIAYGKKVFQLPDSAVEGFVRYYHELSQRIWSHLKDGPAVHVALLSGEESKKPAVRSYVVGQQELKVIFNFQETEHYLEITVEFRLGDVKYTREKAQAIGSCFFILDEALYFLEDANTVRLLNVMSSGVIRFSRNMRSAVLTKVLPQFLQTAEVQLPEGITLATEEVSPEPVVYLKELDEKFLTIEPRVKYGTREYNLHASEAGEFYTMSDENTLTRMSRDLNREKHHHAYIQTLHPLFQRQRERESFYLPFGEAKKDHWLVKFVQALRNEGISVFGLDTMKQLRYSTQKASVKISASSGLDWFDLKIDLSFGDQKVPLDALIQAIRKGERYILLGDGSLGMLPEEWLNKYDLLLRMGAPDKKGKLRIGKNHFTLLDNVSDEINEPGVKLEIHQLRERLQSFDSVKTVRPGKGIKAQLRPYQVHGFEWMQVLDQMKWGGLLADDMGLGKTLQTITFLDYVKRKNKGQTSLVICPTSLIFNWQNEIRQFAPSLRFKVHYGLERSLDEDDFSHYDVVISSYGVVRSDIEMLCAFDWHYIIIDESQAIKNPESQTAKCLQRLKSYNRIALSGTPIQNNTFDLYSQFEFVNPGLLGNKNFFREQFAQPIDKGQDAAKSEQLKKLVNPFLLRRTKEQVAADLPEKTEINLWYDMASDQRAIYEEYKLYYRTALMNKIEEVGMEKAGIYILEGLLRLRQICDSPMLLGHEQGRNILGVKTEELLREMEENMGDHKMLVFSQFTSMLDIIESKLATGGIGFVRLDGSTSQKSRKEAVERFQQDATTSVFLISLKAGGTGLNLTAADYVFLVDPWWNPAAEQQAIDRTHRIGQQKNVFAYRLLCRDSIEEKIMELQKRKKGLADDLISEDKAMFKKLKKEDIEFLFA